jgi:hypothetical protein
MPVSKNGYYYYNIPKWTSHCLQQKTLYIQLKTIILFLRYILSIDAGVINTSVIIDTALKSNKIQFKADVKRMVTTKAY